MGATHSSPRMQRERSMKDLAARTHFTLNEVEALRELFSLVSQPVDPKHHHNHYHFPASAITHDPSRQGVSACLPLWCVSGTEKIPARVLKREDFTEALFGQRDVPHLFGDRVFDLFDASGEGVITFTEFVQALSVFHPAASSEEKQSFAFRLYDLDGTGAIERGEVKDMLHALMRDNPKLNLPESALDRIIDKTFEEVDLYGDGKIHFDEWKALVLRNPAVINNMTLPVLRDVAARYSGFILNTSASSSDDLGKAHWWSSSSTRSHRANLANIA